ncbi:hypothetical protein CFE70_007260 [Pyrenophora teres f. teres 0-1]|uniref:Herpes-BLLF1 multi-domain protein n=2 Tax=Pyrenophora teres f. teres TaxID=97479 RepID=E3RII7_PYRTT|nr:hypothetical protein PTT_07860 [Pyrenophora teres f. teres 0-1]KAE8825752.1 hypothetical protein HRS9139_08862 [Pyrenophora teres f. teres]KAE8834849.1 hypothetical protein PTNB85_06182 [Pyrenophora teres f. teres]KAE8843673.1 hypothetical protein HRS9122_04776 [Pyrenophora teres f. teres]KAE8859269.1 hypothetical protein PTNB73_08749 [Pyrenophora teres f. teres]
MAETIGLIASVLQLAGTGLKLSQALYEYADAVASADRRIRDIAKEVRLTSFVIEELGSVFRQDDTSSVISDKAVQTANETMEECSVFFAEIEVTLNKSKKGKLGRLLLPFRDSKIELLRSHIDKLKSTLQLLMQVLTHAYQVWAMKIDREAEEKQREEIRRLLENKKNSTKRWEESLRNLSISDSSTAVDDDERSVDEEDGPTFGMATIGSTMTRDTLVHCVDSVRTLLEDITILEQAISSNTPGDDCSEDHQRAVGSYFRARSQLDSVLLGGNSDSLRNSGDKHAEVKMSSSLYGSANSLQNGNVSHNIPLQLPSKLQHEASSTYISQSSPKLVYSGHHMISAAEPHVAQSEKFHDQHQFRDSILKTPPMNLGGEKRRRTPQVAPHKPVSYSSPSSSSRETPYKRPYIPASAIHPPETSIYEPTSTGYAPTSPSHETTDEHTYIPMSPVWAPASPGYAPTSPGYVPTSPQLSPGYSPVSPGYSPTSPTSPGYNSRSDTNMPDRNRTESNIETTSLSISGGAPTTASTMPASEHPNQEGKVTTIQETTVSVVKGEEVSHLSETTVEYTLMDDELDLDLGIDVEVVNVDTSRAAIEKQTKNSDNTNGDEIDELLREWTKVHM